MYALNSYIASYYSIRAVEPAPELGGYTCATTETDAPKKDKLMEVCSRKISIKVGVSASISARATKKRALTRDISIPNPPVYNPRSAPVKGRHYLL